MHKNKHSAQVPVFTNADSILPGKLDQPGHTQTEIDETGGEHSQTSAVENQESDTNSGTKTTGTAPQEGSIINDDTNSSTEPQDAVATESTDGTPTTGVKKDGKERAARTVSKERREELILLILAIAAELPERGSFDAQSFAKTHNLVLSLVKDIFVDAQEDFDKLVKYKDKPEPKGLVISKKSNLMLKIEDIEELNKTRKESERFKIGDGFQIAAQGEQIILTRITRAA
ncbi:hypothetical protein [Solidesulfovibrio magneticus]|uniref:Uncharacterized protein n=1 Tax=Solidesulfovibrio magneticus (strain ATCC 700980 / DSM 13731 / RS-1) TaxID=573370 RepID=C4XM53_SOLM1|nr:hypothetical protein [Solidesulfovibrio magneticus]BAH77181.1 hypothetical protein DMR_36900 [Solidesulfovibrio magneticus RS-1]